MAKHFILVEVETDTDTNTVELALDAAFTLGLEGGIAGGYIGDPDDHAFYGAKSVTVHAVTRALQ